MVCGRPGWPEAADRRETGAAENLTETERHDGRVRRGERRVREDRFVLIGGFSGASGREENSSQVSKGHLPLASCFQRKKLKAGNVSSTIGLTPVCCCSGACWEFCCQHTEHFHDKFCFISYLQCVSLSSCCSVFYLF